MLSPHAAHAGVKPCERCAEGVFRAVFWANHRLPQSTLATTAGGGRWGGWTCWALAGRAAGVPGLCRLTTALLSKPQPQLKTHTHPSTRINLTSHRLRKASPYQEYNDFHLSCRHKPPKWCARSARSSTRPPSPPPASRRRPRCTTAPRHPPHRRPQEGRRSRPP